MLVILSGVAGAGKDTIIKALTKKMNICTVPAYTTREPRADDIPGVSYNFVSKEEFEALIENGDIYEYDIHHHNYYGTSKHLINEKAKDGIVIKDIDVNGTEKLKSTLKEMGIKVVTIFLRVPKEELKRRLENRIDKLSHNTPNLLTIIKIANFLNVSLDYLTGRSSVNDFSQYKEEQKNKNLA